VTYHRLDFHNRSQDLDPGLEARVADPLWMLARQWQLGEFAATDGGSPVSIRVEGTKTRLSGYRPQPSGPLKPLPNAPLEVLIESEAVTDGPAAEAHAGEAGLALFRAIDQRGELPLTLREDLRRDYGFVTPEPTDPLDTDSARRLALLRRRSFDARRLVAVLAQAPTQVPAGLAVAPGAETTALLAVLHRWLQGVQSRFAELGGDHWNPARMEYTFEVFAEGPDGVLVARAPEYADGRLDWTDFDLKQRQTVEGAEVLEEPQRFELAALPKPVRFGGMPVSRFWEFENRAVYLGDVDAGPTDLVRLLLIEFALIAGEDWYEVPIELEYGTLTRLDEVLVTDTFGFTLSVLPATAVDHGSSSPFQMFVSTGDPALAAPSVERPWLLLVPSLAQGLEDRPIEEVSFFRDEMANLAWGIEHTIEGASGDPQRRREHWLKSRPPAPVPPSLPTYELQTTVPDYWFPFVPVQDPNQRSIRLRRGKLFRGLGVPLELPLGRLLEPGVPLRMHEEEIPRSGMRVQRAWQMARGADGSSWLWVGRRKIVGYRGRASNLEHDRLVEPR
jgi:hypothetical protein